jgi:hypothetical protein
MSEALFERFPYGDLVFVTVTLPESTRVRLVFEDLSKNIIVAPKQWRLFNMTADPPVLVNSYDGRTYTLYLDYDYQLCTSAAGDRQIIATIGYASPWIHQSSGLPPPFHVTVRQHTG